MNLRQMRTTTDRTDSTDRGRQPARRDAVRVEAVLNGSSLHSHEIVNGLTTFASEHSSWRIISRRGNFPFSAQWLRDHHVDGLLVWSHTPALDAARAAGIPTVDVLPRQHPDHSAVDIDDAAVGRAAAETLLERGFTHFGYCGIPIAWSRVRGDSFRHAIEAAGHTVTEVVVPFDPAMREDTRQVDADRVSQWLRDMAKPAAVFAGIDPAADLVLRQCEILGLLVPDDVAVLGAGNHDMTCELGPIPLASIDLGLSRVAHRACEVLASLLNGEAPPSKPIRIPPLRVVERRSIDTQAHADPLVRRAMHLIRTQATEAMRVCELADLLGVSERTLNRRLTAATGQSPARAIRHARGRAAHDMIRQTALPLADIAARCGFSDQAHLNREIRHHYQTTPMALRSEWPIR